MDNPEKEKADWCIQEVMRCNLCLEQRPLEKFESHRGLAIYVCGECQLQFEDRDSEEN